MSLETMYIMFSSIPHRSGQENSVSGQQSSIEVEPQVCILMD